VRPAGQVDLVAYLAERGLSQSRIAAVTGIPRGTVRMWLAGAIPQPDACCALRARLPGAAYCHLLGLYLGDGHISLIPRTPRLRIFYDARYPGLIGEGIRSMRAVLPHARFTNESGDIKRILCDHLDLLEIEWRPVGHRHISIARRASVARLDEFVGAKL
jgi:hypothetical protein